MAINKSSNNNGTITTAIHPSMKRPRAPIACYRCHHKKVRCDGVHPNCTRCLSTGVICAYPSSRRSRNTQPTNVDPFIDNLSQLEARIRRIETDLESQRALVRTVVNSNNSSDHDLTTCMLKTEKELQESRSIVAQLRLRGEQRVARGRRAAAAAAKAEVDRKPPIKKRSEHRKPNHKRHQQRSSPYPTNATAVVTKEDMFLAHHHSTTSSSFYFPTNTDFIQYFPTTTTTTSTFSQPSSYGTSAEAFSDCWPLLNEDTNEFVDPMIIAAAISTSSSSATDEWLDPPLLAVSSYNGSPNQHLNLPHLQPSSSTSTTSSQSFSVIQQQAMYSTQPLMDDMIMLDPHQQQH